jgi:polyhydroxybutyrate depolymerase
MRWRRALLLIPLVLAAPAVPVIVRQMLHRRGPPPATVLPVWTGADAGAMPLPARSPGCDGTGAPTGDLMRTVTVGGRERHYRMIVPAGKPARPMPVVFFYGGWAPYLPNAPANRPPVPASMSAGGLPALPEVATGAIYVAPRGTPFPKDRSVGWYSGCPGEDIDFFDAMLSAIGESHCIDPRAVLVTGFSWGADMTLALACCRGDKIRAIAPASGAYLAGMPRCPAPRMPALRATYDREDPSASSAELVAAVTFFRQVHHCAAESDPVEPAPCISYRGCDAPVIQCEHHGLGHNLPPGFARRSWGLLADLIAADR